jgi:hypothetical protein
MPWNEIKHRNNFASNFHLSPNGHLSHSRSNSYGAVQWNVAACSLIRTDESFLNVISSIFLKSDYQTDFLLVPITQKRPLLLA